MNKWLINSTNGQANDERNDETASTSSASEFILEANLVIPEHSETESSTDENPGDVKEVKTLKRGKRAARSWMTDPDFKSWLVTEDTDFSKMRCNICKISLTPQLSNIQRHLNSKKHKDLASSEKFVLPIPFKKIVCSKETKTNEIRTALFVACHTSMNSVDHLMKIQKKICSCTSVQGMLLNRTKLTAVLKNAIAPHIVDCIKRDIGTSTFSLIIDESTDISVQKYLGIVIKYFSQSRNQIVTLFLKLVALIDCTASGIVSAIKDVLVEFGLCLEKLSGLGTDNAYVMTGCRNGVYEILKNEVQNLVLIPCVCHSLQLAVSKAAEKTLPDEIEFLVAETFNWFSRSSSRQNAYKTLYTLINNGHNPKRIVRACDTRWMSIHSAIERILSQWLELKTHFQIAKTKEKCHKAALLFDLYSNDGNIIYLEFLKNILGQVKKVNSLFESNTADITKIIDDLVILIKSLVSILIPADIPHFDPLHSLLCKKYWHISPYLGYTTENLIQESEIDRVKIKEIREKCHNFLLELIDQLRARLPPNIKVLQNINCFNVKSIFRDKDNSRIKISELVENFLPLEKRMQILNQLNNLYLVKWKHNENSIEFWSEVLAYEDAENDYPFEDIGTFAMSFLVLPFSNAEVERVFSIMNLIKTKIRNRMGLPLLNALIQIKSWLKSLNKCCHDFEIDIDDQKLSIVGSKKCYNERNSEDDESDEAFIIYNEVSQLI